MEVKAQFEQEYPGEPFNLIDRSLYDCLSGERYEMEMLDRTDTTYTNEFNSNVIDGNLFLG